MTLQKARRSLLPTSRRNRQRPTPARGNGKEGCPSVCRVSTAVLVAAREEVEDELSRYPDRRRA